MSDLMNIGLNAGVSLGSDLGGMSALGGFESGFNDALSLAGIGTQGLGNFSGAGSAGLFQSVAGSFGQQSNIGQMLSEITNLLQQLQSMMANGSGGGSGGCGGAAPGGSAPAGGTGGYTPTGGGCGDPSGGLTCSGNDTVNTGRYTITSTNQNGGTTTIKDNQTGVTDTIWGDPHLTSSTGQAGEFQNGPMTIQLADGTDVEIVPTAKNSSGVATTSQVIVTKGQGAVILTGQQSSSGVTSSGVLDGGGSVMQNNFPADTVLTQGNNGTLYQTNQCGQATTAIGDNPSTDLDNLGGALAGGNGMGGTSGAGSQNSQIMNMLQQILQMVQQMVGQQSQANAGGGAASPNAANNQIMQMLQEIVQMLEQMTGGQQGSGGAGGAGGGDPFSQIISLLQQIDQNTSGGAGQQQPQASSSGGGSSTLGEIGSIISAVAPIAMAFL